MTLFLILWMIQWESSKTAAVNTYEVEYKHPFPSVRQITQNVISMQRTILPVLQFKNSNRIQENKTFIQCTHEASYYKGLKVLYGQKLFCVGVAVLIM